MTRSGLQIRTDKVGKFVNYGTVPVRKFATCAPVTDCYILPSILSVQFSFSFITTLRLFRVVPSCRTDVVQMSSTNTRKFSPLVDAFGVQKN